ncbi:MAG: sigma-70 family RNA polymerase sigma factor [Planctomycetes bacterium]|nr:sigma-70 family RNA polymerase sigma factor [Planctomycetota bacterium]
MGSPSHQARKLATIAGPRPAIATRARARIATRVHAPAVLSQGTPAAPRAAARFADGKTSAGAGNAHRSVQTDGRRARARAAQRERALSRLWRVLRKSKTAEARNELALAYQDLVSLVVRRFAMRLPRSVDRGDLQTAGNFGLMAAIESFDPSLGVRFESYAELRIRGALLDELRNEDWLPRPWRARLERHRRVVEELRGKKGSEPSELEIATALELSLTQYRQLFAVSLPGAPNGAHTLATGESGGDLDLLDVVVDPRLDAPEERLSREELLRLVAQRLSEQEYRIVYLKYWEELSMREIGELEDLSESRVCKIHTKLLERLHDRLRVQYDAG